MMHGYIGVGKTTAATKIACMLSNLGFRTEVINNDWVQRRTNSTVNSYRYALPEYFTEISAARRQLYMTKVQMAREELSDGADFVILDTTSKKRFLRDMVYSMVGPEHWQINPDKFYVIHCGCKKNAAIAGMLQKNEFRSIIDSDGFDQAVTLAKEDYKAEVATTERMSPNEQLNEAYFPKITLYNTLDEDVNIINYEQYSLNFGFCEPGMQPENILHRKNEYLSTYEQAHAYLAGCVPDLNTRLSTLGYSGKDWVLETIIAALSEKTRTKEFLDAFNSEVELGPEQYASYLKMKKEEMKKIEIKMSTIFKNLDYPI